MATKKDGNFYGKNYFGLIYLKNIPENNTNLRNMIEHKY
jgi:hypothetical protein